MTTKTIKIVLFTGLVLSMLVGVSGIILVDAQTHTDDQERISTKIQQIDENFAEYKLVRAQTDLLEAEHVVLDKEIQRLEIENSSELASVTQQRDSIQAQIDAKNDEIDRLQTTSFELYTIPKERQDLLNKAMHNIMNVYPLSSRDNSSTMLDDVFINAKNEAIYVIKNSDAIEKNSELKNNSLNLDSKIRSMVDDSIRVIITEQVVNQSGCTYDSERDDYCQPAAGGVKIQGENFVTGYEDAVETSTLSFPATRNSVSGFVMIGHGTLSQDGGEDIHQPTESGSSYKIGDLVVGFLDDDCDCSFIDLSPGRTVDPEVVYNTIFNLDIDDYIPKSSQSNGQYVTMSGLASGVELGQITSTNTGNNWVYADYDSAATDSGAPVGKVLSGEIDIYGIHKGRVVSEDLAQYVPYDVIEDNLGLD